ncbi:MAG: class I lanthipeptide [Acidobacteria bacterium]|nr:class I lanthipeptide [Acidobacteriota bacterium]
MKKNLPRKLNLNRETLRQLDESDLRVLAGAAPTGECPFTLQVACHSNVIPTCVCTGTGPTV